MSTTGTATAVIALPEAGLGPCAGLEPTAGLEPYAGLGPHAALGPRAGLEPCVGPVPRAGLGPHAGTRPHAGRGRFGPDAVAEASRRLLTVSCAGTGGGEAPPLRQTAAPIRRPALIAGPGTRSGLTLDLPARLLEEEFGRGRVARFEDVDFPATLTHEPTRRFLRETGLPEDGLLFRLDTDIPLPTLAEYYADKESAGLPPTGLPLPADRLIRLGRLAEDNTLVLDGGTGAVWNRSEPEAALRPLDTDVSVLAFTLWLLHRKRRTGFQTEAGGAP
nr:hypothetical protein StreXyl84_39490 [Streptomyces sp. Xyl84]